MDMRAGAEFLDGDAKQRVYPETGLWETQGRFRAVVGHSEVILATDSVADFRPMQSARRGETNTLRNRLTRSNRICIMRHIMNAFSTRQAAKKLGLPTRGVRSADTLPLGRCPRLRRSRAAR